jgi:hypothetical protein
MGSRDQECKESKETALYSNAKAFQLQDYFLEGQVEKSTRILSFYSSSKSRLEYYCYLIRNLEFLFTKTLSDSSFLPLTELQHIRLIS